MSDFLPVLLGSDANVYGMARSFYQQYGVRSVAIGRGKSGTMELRFTEPTADIQIGDIVITSGLDGLYPAGLAVARVTLVERNAHGPFGRVVCQPLAGIERNTQLLILMTSPEMPARPPTEEVKTGRKIAGKMAPIKDPAKEAAAATAPGIPQTTLYAIQIQHHLRTINIRQGMTVLDFKQVLIRIVQSTEIKCIGSSNLDSFTCFIGQSQPAGITTPTHRLRTGITLFHIIDSRLVFADISRILPIPIIFYRTATIPFQLLQRRIKEGL